MTQRIGNIENKMTKNKNGASLINIGKGKTVQNEGRPAH